MQPPEFGGVSKVASAKPTTTTSPGFSRHTVKTSLWVAPRGIDTELADNVALAVNKSTDTSNGAPCANPTVTRAEAGSPDSSTGMNRKGNATFGGKIKSAQRQADEYTRRQGGQWRCH